MGHESGLGDHFYIGGYDLSGDIASLDSISSPVDSGDVTGIDKAARERLLMRRDGQMSFTSFFNATTAQEHAVLSLLPRTDVIATYAHGSTLLNASACVNGKQVSYDGKRDDSGALTFKSQVMANGFGLEWGVLLTAGPRTDSGAVTGAAVDDNGAGTAHGAQAYLQVLGLNGTNVQVKIRHATTSGGTYADLIDFGSRTAAGAFRGTATGTVNQFLKVVTSGTFTTAVIVVTWMRNQADVVF